MTSSELERAGLFIQNVIATDGASDPLAHVRFAEALARDAEQRTKRRHIAVGGGCAVALAVAVWGAQALQPSTLTYRVENTSEPGTLGSYVSAPPRAPLSLQFSEGSRVVLQPRARGRVAQTTRRGATMVLEDGSAHAEIKHLDKTEWRVLAGPFVVGVKGTTFDVAFDVETQMFELRMQSGSVQVTGPGLKEPVDVTDRQHLVLSARGTDVSNVSSREATPEPGSVTPGSVGAEAPETNDRASSNASDRSALKAHGLPGTPHRTTSADADESFSQLGARGQHQRIVELAERRGFDSIVATANRTDLLALGNAARFSGRNNLASMAYRAVRDRFARSSEAAAAAFFLGRLSESTNPAQAVTWFERYVAEAPTGVWVADALGRRMVVLSESKSGASAQSAAQEYLTRFPAGPYAGFARKLLGP
jgi:TolA-binding protein